MIRLKVCLKPKKNNPISINYQYNLALICNKIISKSTEDFGRRLAKYNSTAIQKMNALLTFTQFTCPKYEIFENKIIFWDVISWYISSPLYELILQLAQEFFTSGTIKIDKEELEITSIEATEENELAAMNAHKDIYSLTPVKLDDINKMLADYYLINEEEKII